MSGKCPGPWKLGPCYVTHADAGAVLAAYKHLPPGFQKSESWEVSAFPGYLSVVTEGPDEGSSIPQLVAKYAERLLGRSVVEKYGLEFPLVMKIVECHSDEPLVVHPSDESSDDVRHGRDEFWYVLDSPVDGKAYIGLNRSVTREQFEQHLLDGTLPDIVTRTSAAPGDVFHIPAGRIHSLSNHVLILEIVDPYDKAYELHSFKHPHAVAPEIVDKVSEVAELIVLPDYHSQPEQSVDGVEGLAHTRHFTVERITITGRKTFYHYQADTFHIFHCIEGEVTIYTCDEHVRIVLHRGDSALVSADARRIVFNGSGVVISAYM